MNLYWIGKIIDSACILMFAAAGDALALTAGEYNLGGDGQIYASAFIAAITLNAAKSLPPFIALLAALIAAVICAGGMALVSAGMKVYRGVDILISTYLLSSALTPIIDSLVAGRFRGKGNLLATSFIDTAFSSPRIMMPSPLTLASLTAPLLCIAVSFVLSRGEIGKRIAIAGVSNDFADYAGLKSIKVSSMAIVFAAAMHAVAGYVMVIGTYRSCISGFQNGVGWSAFTASLIARRRVIKVIPACLILSIVITLSSRYTLTHLIGFDVASLIQGITIAIIAVEDARRRK